MRTSKSGTPGAKHFTFLITLFVSLSATNRFLVAQTSETSAELKAGLAKFPEADTNTIADLHPWRWLQRRQRNLKYHRDSALIQPMLDNGISVAAINYRLTKDDPPAFMTYGVNRPVTEESSAGLWVHHFIMGIKLEEVMDRLGVESHVEYQDRTAIERFENRVDFLLKKLKRAGIQTAHSQRVDFFDLQPKAALSFVVRQLN